MYENEFENGDRLNQIRLRSCGVEGLVGSGLGGSSSG